jgi:transposase
MLTWEGDVEAAALRAQGWSISAIARHLGRDRKTIRAYLDGDRIPGQRRHRGSHSTAPRPATPTST